jgi:hypothetical protein
MNQDENLNFYTSGPLHKYVMVDRAGGSRARDEASRLPTGLEQLTRLYTSLPAQQYIENEATHSEMAAIGLMNALVTNCLDMCISVSHISITKIFSISYVHTRSFDEVYA